MNQSKHFAFLALIFSALIAAASPLRAAKSDWNHLQALKPDVQVRVVQNDDKSYEGAFQSMNDSGITLRLAAGSQTFARPDIFRIYFRSKNNRLRNTLIGVGIGAALAALAQGANHWGENTGIRTIWWVWPVGMGTFGGIGAAIPTGGWHVVYRAPKHRTPATGRAAPAVG